MRLGQVQLVGKMRPHRELPGREVCHQGDTASRVWLLTEGQVLVVVNGEEGQMEGDPAVLGETALLQDEASRFRAYPVGFRWVGGWVLWWGGGEGGRAPGFYVALHTHSHPCMDGMWVHTLSTLCVFLTKQKV